MSLIEVMCGACVLVIGFGTALFCWQSTSYGEKLIHDKLATSDGTAFVAERLIGNLSAPASVTENGINCSIRLEHGGGSFAGLTQIICTADGVSTNVWVELP